MVCGKIWSVNVTFFLIMGLMIPDYDMVTKVTIIPRSGGAGGFTLFTPTEERLESGMYTKKYLLSQLQVALGGRVAEEIIYGKDEITTGASSDLQNVASLARRMVRPTHTCYPKPNSDPITRAPACLRI